MSKEKPMWTDHRITWTFSGKLCGSLPKDPEMLAGFINGRKPKTMPAGAKTIPEIQQEIAATMLEPDDSEELEQRSWLGFQSVNGGLVMRGATVRAHFKDCARIVNAMYIGKLEKEKSLQWKITNGLYVQEYWIPLIREDGKPAIEADGYMDKAVHTMTRSGPINALKRIDFLNQVSMSFTLRLLAGVRIEDVETIMQYGAIHGYAGERSEGEGRYTYQIESLEK